MTSRSPLRSLMLAAGAVAIAASTLASCGSSDDNAFTMNGKVTSGDDTKQLVQAILDDEIIQPENNDISGKDLRTLLTWLIQNQAAEEFFASVGESITADDKQATIDANQQNFDGLLEVTTDFFATHESIRSVWTRVVAPGEAQVKKLYEQSPARSGSLCLSHILVKTEDEAKNVLKKLRDGAKFADVAKSTSIDTGSGARGGSLGSTETNDCLTNSTILEKFDSQFNAGALKATIGTPSDPIKTQFGWHIILHRPWSEIGADVMENLKTEPGREMYIGYLMSSKILVNPKYGRWDPVALTVVNPKASSDPTDDTTVDDTGDVQE